MELKEELRKLIELYAKAHDTDFRAGCRDVLTEIRHLADDEGFDFGVCDYNAEETYREELDLKKNEG